MAQVLLPRWSARYNQTIPSIAATGSARARVRLLRFAPPAVRGTESRLAPHPATGHWISTLYTAACCRYLPSRYIYSPQFREMPAIWLLNTARESALWKTSFYRNARGCDKNISVSKLSTFAYTADISVLHINTHLYLVVTKYLFSVRVSRVDRLRTESRIGRLKKRKGKIYLLNTKIY